jgi:predicted O-methyltransferase YrrM
VPLGLQRRGRLEHPLAEARWMAGLAQLPPSVAWFHVRARHAAWRSADAFTLISATRAPDLRVLLGLAGNARRIVELGTATGWTAISLALSGRDCEVVSYDVVEREERERYLRLVSAAVRDRIELVLAPGSSGPRDARAVDLLYIDSSHEREQTVAEVLAWRPALRSGGMIVFDDFAHPDYPGVREAVAQLGLPGVQRGSLLIHRSE